MRLDKRKPSGREKDEASIKLLAQLREKLHSEQVGTARRAAFNLSWMQEDGLDILKEALFSRASRNAKSAAAYGLRKMRGRMEKIALDLLSQGLKYPDRSTATVCENALIVLKSRYPGKFTSEEKIQIGKLKIRQIQQKKRRKEAIQNVGNRRNNFPK